MRYVTLVLSWLVLVAGPVRAATQEAEKSAPQAASTTDPVEKEYEKLLEDDDAAQAAVDKWIRDNQAFAEKGGGATPEQLNRRIDERFAPVRQAYEDFLKRHPEHARARIAYGSFLGDTGDEDGSRTQWEKALELDTNNPAIYNNLAGVYGHSGPIKKAFDYYQKAIDLSPREPVYYHNFGTAVFLFRKDAKEHFGISEDAVFAKAFGLYSNAMRLDPMNFPLASDVAQSYYGITPLRADDALKAWTNAWNLAHDEIEREGVSVHFARIKISAGRYDQARAHLNSITNAMYGDLKARLTRNLNEREKGVGETNRVDAASLKADVASPKIP